MSKQTAGNAPDNNRRLAALEAGVSALAIALTANGAALEDGADPIEAAIARVKHAAQLDDRLVVLIHASTSVIGRFAPDMELAPKDEAESLIDVQIRLLEQLATHETPCDRKIKELEAQISAGPNGATEGEIAAIARADAADAALAAAKEELAELNADVEDLANEKNRLANELAAANEGRPQAATDAGGDEPEEVAATAVRERPEAARDVGPNAGGLSAAELDDLLTTGEVHGLELVFSNGDYEIMTLQPVAISPNQLQPIEGRHAIIPPIFAKLLSTDQQEEIAGAGLLLEGEQIAYCAFPDRLTLLPGGERRFERAIYF